MGDSCKDQVQILYKFRMFSFYLLALLLLSVHDVFGSQCRGNCGQGEGDCDNNEECQDGLWCEFDYWWGDDYCRAGPETVNYAWSAWGEYGDCPVSCGGAEHSRYRVCDSPAPAHGGDDCTVDGSTDTETEKCNENPCPINGGWGDFGTWTPCT